MNLREMDDRIAELRIKRNLVRAQFFQALNNGKDQEAGALDEQDCTLYWELHELLKERAKHP